jgi:hypothetical protein
MKKAFVALSCLLILHGSCKKAIDKIKENMLVDAMVDGQWKVTSFVLDGTNITTQYQGYTFQYFESRDVNAIKNGTVEYSGTWDGDIATESTWANFPTATEPISHINGTWHIDNSSWTYVVASQTSGGITKVMRLDKI